MNWIKKHPVWCGLIATSPLAYFSWGLYKAGLVASNSAAAKVYFVTAWITILPAVALVSGVIGEIHYWHSNRWRRETRSGE